MAALAEEMKGPIHALTLDVKTPDESTESVREVADGASQRSVRPIRVRVPWALTPPQKSSSDRTSCTNGSAWAGWPPSTARSSAASKASSASSRSSACCRTSRRTRASSSRSCARPSSRRCCNHVNIVQIYELGRVGTEYFISMEYIDGRDIRRILRHARKVTGPAADPRHGRPAAAAVRRARLRAHQGRRRRPSARARPSRRLAVEPARHDAGPPQGHRLRHREGAVVAAAHADRAREGQARVHGARGDLGQGSRRALATSGRAA